jgi:predicted negative regulator of RcsB-dependent stress response
MTYPLGEILLMAGRYYESGQLELADQLCQQVLQSHPGNIDAVHLQGLLALASGKLDCARDCLRQVVQTLPHLAEAHNNLGSVLLQMGDLDAAITAFQEALRLKPTFAEAIGNQGTALLRQGKTHEAQACFEQAVRVAPQFADAHHYLGIVRLLLGDFQGGWPEYEWRWRTRKFESWLLENRYDFREAPWPRWDGSSLSGRTVLLQTEQGLGDTFQFIRYARLVRERGGRVLVEAPPLLTSLLRTCPGVDRVIEKLHQPPKIEVHASLLSLPGLFGTTLETIPAAVPYLFADPALVARWRQELAPDRAFKVGIAWQGTPSHENDRYRSCPLDQFAVLARVPNVRLFGLQVGPGHEQLQSLNGLFAVTDLAERFNKSSFADAAAVIENLDLVMTVDTAIAHLAGALGRPVWLALAVCVDWRWLLEREDSPWYPSMRLFRQTRLGRWDDVFERMAGELQLRTAKAK